MVSISVMLCESTAKAREVPKLRGSTLLRSDCVSRVTDPIQL